MERRLAVALHDVEPATYERCALIRDWLDDQGVARVTLLVVPAPDRHPFDRRSPELAAWLAERRDAGDSVAQQGERDTRGSTPALHAVLARSFDWWAALRSVHPMRRLGLRPTALDEDLLRLDIHPADLAGGRRVAALEALLRRASDRATITYDAL